MKLARKPTTSSPDDAPDLPEARFRRLSPPSPQGALRPALVFAGTAAVVFLRCAAPAAAQAEPARELGADRFESLRAAMVENHVRPRIRTSTVLAAMREVPRHLFVPENLHAEAYGDQPVVFAPGQTLPQAALSAQMIDLLGLDGDEKVLEIGTGSGYDAALLSRLAREVLTIEIDTALARRAERLLKSKGYDNVRVRQGDGYHGWPEEAPFDAILVTAAPKHIPEPLFEQLKVGGRMVVAVGDMIQDLQVITKTDDGNKSVRRIRPVVLGHMTGEAQED